MIGSRFQRLTVLEYAGVVYTGVKRTLRRDAYLCRCDCGSTLVVTRLNLQSGNSKSCGCLRSDVASKRYRHGRNSSDPTYSTWNSMRDRCRNQNSGKFKNYGKRGITVCDSWKVFENFLRDMGERPIGKTLDRLNVNGNYEPSNCRWATNQEQASNKTTTRLVSIGGTQYTLSEAARAHGMYVSTLHKRLARGMSADEAVGVQA